MTDYDLWEERDHYQTRATESGRRAEAAEAERDRLREALERISVLYPRSGNMTSVVAEEARKIARAALEAKP